MIANGDHDNVSVLLNTSKPAITVTPSSLAFGSQTLHTTSPPLDVAIANTGSAKLRIDNVGVRGTAANRFAITGENCTGDSLLVGEGCAVSVSFTPNQQGSVSATLRITDNAPGSPHDVALSGTGVVPACTGADATIVGTAGADTLVGTPGNDVAALLGGDDTFRGGNGNDTICGGNGDDDLNGQVGLDSCAAATATTSFAARTTTTTCSAARTTMTCSAARAVATSATAARAPTRRTPIARPSPGSRRAVGGTGRARAAGRVVLRHR